MILRNGLTPDAQRQRLANEMRISRSHDWVVRCQTAEALAHSRELLRAPVYVRPKHTKDAGSSPLEPGCGAGSASALAI